MRMLDAPLYIKAQDTYVSIARICSGIEEPHWRLVSERLLRHALILTEEIAVALEFKVERLARLRRIDHRLRRMKTMCALLHRGALITDDQYRTTWASLLEIGRMLGGFIKRQEDA